MWCRNPTPYWTNGELWQTSQPSHFRTHFTPNFGLNGVPSASAFAISSGFSAFSAGPAESASRFPRQVGVWARNWCLFPRHSQNHEGPREKRKKRGSVTPDILKSVTPGMLKSVTAWLRLNVGARSPYPEPQMDHGQVLVFVRMSYGPGICPGKLENQGSTSCSHLD